MIILLYLMNMKKFLKELGTLLYKMFVFNTEPVTTEIVGADGLTWVIYRHGTKHGYYLKESDKPKVMEKVRQLAIQAEENQRSLINK